jgi:hypothetical protein
LTDGLDSRDGATIGRYSALLAVICAGLLAATAAGAREVAGKATTHAPVHEEARPPNGFEVEGSDGWSISVSTVGGGFLATARRHRDPAAAAEPSLRSVGPVLSTRRSR